MKIKYWILVTFFSLFSNPLYALRCGHSLVDLGDDKDYVSEICGDPSSVESHYERRGNTNHADLYQNNFDGNHSFPRSGINYGQANYREIEVLVEDWYYDFGSERLRKILRFENGRLAQILDNGRRRR